MPINIEASRLIRKLQQARREFPRALEAEMSTASERVKTRAISRFTRRFSGSRSAQVLRAIQASGIEVIQSRDDETTILLYDTKTLDALTQERAKATGKIHHLWRILHEGSGPAGASTGINHPFLSKGFSPRYPIQAIVQTSALEPFYSPGRHPPYLDLINLEGNGVVILRHNGFEGHAWFLRNQELFQEDEKLFENAVIKAIRKVFK